MQHGVFHKDDSLSISQHMESHYRRIANVKGRIDTGMPTAMKLGVKSKSQNSRDRHRKKKRIIATQSNSHRREVEPKLDPVLDFPPLKGPGTQISTSTPRSDLYSTQTGRTQGRSPSPKKELSSASPPLWIPVMNTRYGSSHKGNQSNQFSKQVFNKRKTKPICATNKDELKSHVSSSPTSDIIEDEHPLLIERNSQELLDLTTNSVDSNNVFGTQRMLRESIAEGNALIRQRIEQSRQEQEYLQFLSAITNDILTKGVYSDSELEALFESYVTRNKKRLREHLMRTKIEWLKRKLDMINV